MNDPPPLDTTRPNPARVRDSLLGGKDNFAADRALAAALEAADPPRPAAPGVLPSAGGRARARENRAFVLAAARRAAAAGIGQLIDLGCGMPRPAGGNVHDAAREISPQARVCYVDTDPLVRVHASALLAGDGVSVSGADLSDPAAVLASPGALAVIDRDQPAGVIAGSALHFLSDDAARDMCARWAAALAPGSWVCLAALCFEDRDLFTRIRDAYTPARLHDHSVAAFRSFFAGLTIVPPGITSAGRWVGNLAEGPPCNTAGCILAAAGIKP